MNLDISGWKPFVTERLFSKLENGKANQQILSEGNNCFYVGAKKDNNGVMLRCLKEMDLITKGNCIIFICNGQGSVGYANYMDADFIGTTDIVAGYNENLNEMTGAFLATIYSQERPKYSFGRKWKKQLKSTTIILPIKHNADGTPFIDNTHKYSDEGYMPDWLFMENYIKELHHKSLNTKNKAGKAPKLNIQKWEDFTVGKLFDIQPSKGICSEDLVEGNDVAYIGAKHDANGLIMLCQKEGFEDWISKGNCIVFIQLGAGSAGYANYMKDDFIGMSGKTSCGYNNQLNEFSGIFIATVLSLERPKYSFGRSWTGDRLKETTIKLPIKHNPDGTPYVDDKHMYSDKGYVPDWKFMEEYIRALPYGDRLSE